MKQQATGVPVGSPSAYQASAPSYLPPGPAPVGTNYQQTLGIPAQAQWSTGLCDCTTDVPSCCLTCWCPCITFGRNAEIIDRGASSCGVSGALYALIAVLTGCQSIYSCTYRTKLKQQYGIMPQSCCQDCCLHLWCHGCALCQEYRELQHRGFDVPLGWFGNVERMNRGMGFANPPVVPIGMTR